MEEIWEDIVGYEGYYQISNLGRVLSFSRLKRTNKNFFRETKETILPGWVNRHGYLEYILTLNGGKKHRAHVLIAKHFIPNPNNHPVVRHLNDVKLDNRLENLAWGTQKDNRADCIRNGNSNVGARNGMYGKPGTQLGKSGELSKCSKIVLDTQTGIFYYGVGDAAKSANIKKDTLTAKLNGKSRNNTKFVYA